MLEYDKIDINEGIDINKNIYISKRCWLCGYWCFIDKIYIHNLCIGYNNGNAYRYNFAFMSKNHALNLIKNAVILDKKGTL